MATHFSNGMCGFLITNCFDEILASCLPLNVSHFVVFRQTKRANSFELALSKRLVELAGVEPASKNYSSLVLHA